MVIFVLTVMKRHYPDFTTLLESIPDHRKRCTYSVAETIMAGLCLSLFKMGSRNNADNLVNSRFERNYINCFGLRLPIQDTVNDFLRMLNPDELETFKKTLVRRLLEKKVFDKWKNRGRHLVAVDGTGIYSFDKEPFPGCPYKTSKTGKVTYSCHVLEAKLVCGNGFCISLSTEWMNNSENLSGKQDCELKAFQRLSEKLKKDYPRLPLILCADALYPNQTFFEICRNNQWEFIVTFKEGTLKTVWVDIEELRPLLIKDQSAQKTVCRHPQKGWFSQNSFYINGLVYRGHEYNWLEYKQGYKGDVPDRFVFLTDISLDKDNVWKVSTLGRLRWTIENQGFNTQKNLGYELSHKYSRKNFWAMRNYYLLNQIGHMINQLSEKLQKVCELLEESGQTWKLLYVDMLASMRKENIETAEIELEIRHIKQLRYP